MKTGRVLIIHDDQRFSRYLKDELALKEGYACHIEPSARSGIDALERENFDLIITKFGLSDMEGTNLIKELKKIDNDCIFIVILEAANLDMIDTVFRLGAYEALIKSINIERLRFVVKKGVELHSLLISNRKFINSLQEHNVSLQRQNSLLTRRIEQSTQNLTRLYEDLRTTYMDTIKAMARAIDARDHYTHSHSENVARYAVMIAEEMGLTKREIQYIQQACELHDLGKIGVKDSILGKEADLTDEEWEKIRQHSLKGAQILEPLNFLNKVVELVKQHHEHWDGAGYPRRLKGEDILLGARIIHLADAYDAMTSARSYRKIPLLKEEAIGEIKKKSAIQFDPKVVEAFLKVAGNF